jgi:hypothetical protein
MGLGWYQDLPQNQCIFVKGFHVIRFLKILPRVRAEADPDQDSSGHEPEFDTQLVSIPANTDVNLSSYRPPTFR